jgi:Putative zinc-finger
MNCEQIEVWISAYQDGELDPGRRRRVEEHLDNCCPCRELVEEWSALELSMRPEMTRFEAPETLHARVMRQIPENRPAVAPAGRRGSFTPGGWFTFGLAPIGALTAWMLCTGQLTSPRVAKPVTPATTVAAGLTDPDGFQVAKIGTPTTPGGTPKVGPNKAVPLPKQIGPKLPDATGSRVRRNESGNGSRNRHDPLRELRRLRPRRTYYQLAFASYPRRPWHRTRHHRHRPELTLVKAQPQLPPVPVPQTPETQEHRLASVPRFRVVDYVLPQVPASTDAGGSETEFVLRRAAAPDGTQVAYEF